MTHNKLRRQYEVFAMAETQYADFPNPTFPWIDTINVEIDDVV